MFFCVSRLCRRCDGECSLSEGIALLNPRLLNRFALRCFAPNVVGMQTKAGDRVHLRTKFLNQEGASRYGKKPYPNEKPIKIQLFAISKDYYYYLVDVARLQGDSGISSGLIDIGAVEPIKIFSNIDGGVGIMGAYNLSEKCVDIIQIMEIK